MLTLWFDLREEKVESSIFDLKMMLIMAKADEL